MAGLEVLDLGGLRYPEAWALQKRLARERVEGRRGDTLLLVEHPSVYTRGTSARGKPSEGLPFPVHDVERGGDITYHGPGQLVGYPIVHLKERGLTVGSFLRLLEAALLSVLSESGLAAQRRRGLTGVWCGERKVASIGVAVSGWVTYHGFALNVDCDLAHFASIRPCGLEPERMENIVRLLGRPLPSARLRRLVARCVEEELCAASLA